MSLWAILPVKEMEGSKQRLSPLLSPAERVALMRVMVAEVLDALCVARGLAGMSVVTLDAWAAAEARRRGARVITEGARDGHTAASRGGAGPGGGGRDGRAHHARRHSRGDRGRGGGARRGARPGARLHHRAGA